MPSPAFALQGRKSDPGVTNVRNVSSPHWRRWLGVEHRCVVPFTSFAEHELLPDESRPPVWFALDATRPLAFFAGIWTHWTSVRKVKEGETTNDLFAFLTTEANKVVGAIHPCKSQITKPARVAGAVADGRPHHPGALKPVPQLGTPSAVPSNPNSREGRHASPIAQGGVKMEANFVGIDVSKDRLDVHVRPSGEGFVVERNGKGLKELVERLSSLAPSLIAVEATGGRDLRSYRAIARLSAQRRQRRGYHGCARPARGSAVERSLPWRSRLRCARLSSVHCRSRSNRRYSQQSDPKTSTPVRSQALPDAQCPRTDVLPAQRLAPHRDTLRQARSKFCIGCGARSRYHLVDQLRLDPNRPLKQAADEAERM